MSNLQQNSKATNHLRTKTILIIVQMAILYVVMISPSPVLSFIAEDLNLYGNNTAMVLPITIAYPLSALFAIVGGVLLQKMGLERLFAISSGAGMLCTVVLFMPNYWGLMISRLFFSISYGISIPLVGASISRWYDPQRQETMNTLNGFYPWIGALLAYLAGVPVYKALGNSWAGSVSSWCLLLVPVFLVWGISSTQKHALLDAETSSAKSGGLRMYLELLHRRDILAITLIYVFDFGFYAYFSAIYSMFLIEGTGLPQETANMLASISFPAVGLVFSLLGGMAASRMGQRKPLIAAGQMLKFVGILLAMLTIRHSLVISLVGISLFTVGNSAYLPPMYMVPMDLKELDAEQVGGSFSLFTATGMVLGGTLAPAIGSKLTDMLSTTVPAAEATQVHFEALMWSVLILNVLNLVAFFIARFLLRETGPAAKRGQR